MPGTDERPHVSVKMRGTEYRGKDCRVLQDIDTMWKWSVEGLERFNEAGADTQGSRAAWPEAGRLRCLFYPTFILHLHRKTPSSFLPGVLLQFRQTIRIRSCAERERSS
jgi:hypothetical protein